MKIEVLFKRIKDFFRTNECVVGFILMIVVATLINRNFLTFENISNVMRQTSMTGIIAIGMAIVIISGSIDLSVGSVYALCGFVSLYMGSYGVALSVIVTLMVGAFAGLINGLLITKLHIGSWVATLSTMLGIRGITLILTHEKTFTPELPNAAFNAISRGAIFTYLNYPIIIFVVISLIAGLFLTYTPLGRNIYARGGNTEAAEMMGINTSSTLLVAHIISGVTASIAGIILAARIGSAHPSSGEGTEMYAIASCVVGGIYLTGGRGRIFGVFIGAMIIGMLTNIFNLQNSFNVFWESVITGTLVLVVVLVQQVNADNEARRKKAIL